jgi:biopolymer transport protein TolR
MRQSLRRGRRQTMRVNADINLVNLVDLAFVLLIIFMITAPIMQAGIEMQLPKAEARPLTSSEAVVVSVSHDQRIFLDQTEVSLEEFPVVFEAYMGTRKGQPVSIQGDARVAWGRLARVLSELQQLGHTDVNMLLEPIAAPPRGRR